MRNHHQRFVKWIRLAPKRERNLRAIAIGLEDKYFRDLQLQHAAAMRRLFTAECADVDGNWESFTSDPPYVSLADDWIFRVAVPPAQRGESEVVLGECQTEKRTIWINPCLEGENIRRPAALLHEMIHAYECQHTAPFREWLTVELYNRMLKRISRPTLHRMIDASTHRIVHNASHGVLFLLKSLDIDLRYRWPLGATFGYGREEMLQGALRKRRRKATA